MTALIKEEFYITIQTRPGHDQIELANLSKSVRGVGLMRATRCDIENMGADICFNNFKNYKLIINFCRDTENYIAINF